MGGAEVLAARLARRLQSNYRFVFACLDNLGTLGEELRQEGFQVEVIGRRAGFDLQCVRRVAQLVADEKIDLIHAHQYTPFFYSRAPGWLGKRAPVLFTEHGRFHPDLPSRKRMTFNHLFLRRQDRVVAVGEAVKTALIKNEGIPAERIQVIYNGVRLQDFQSSPNTREQLRRELGIGIADPVAIQVARLDYLKDHCTAVRMAERVRRQLPNFRLVLVGEGPERGKIEQEVAARQLQNNVLLLGQRSDIANLLTIADFFLLTSISEGIPVTFIEAMGAGLPIVSTAVGGVAEVVIDQQTGLLAPAGDDESLSKASIPLLESATMRERLGQEGRLRAQSSFTEEAMHAGYADVYQKILLRCTRRTCGAVAANGG